MNVAILDDYQNVALRLADWSGVRRRAEITVFNSREFHYESSMPLI